jgi:hypothetical protein
MRRVTARRCPPLHPIGNAGHDAPAQELSGERPQSSLPACSGPLDASYL